MSTAARLGRLEAVDGPTLFFEIITAEELAARWRVPESWVRTNCQTRCTDPIPHIKLGRYARFRWQSPELEAWLKRRQRGNGAGK